MASKGKEKFRTYHAVFDNFTNRNLFKLISEGLFDGLESPIATGKESNVFSAKKGSKRVIVKIYRLETCDFNRMYDYIRSDPRYQRLKKKKRDIIFSWAQREYRNLLKAREAGIKVPTPLAIKQNILVLEMIGDPAPKLKDAHPKAPKKFFEEIIGNMRKLYKAGIVHADLSSFNILNNNEKPVFIDFSQATPLENHNACEFLERDIRNVASYFSKIGLKVNNEEIKSKITRNPRKAIIKNS